MELEEAKKELQGWVQDDRRLRDNKVESDYEKFCENNCIAIETVLQELEHLKKENESLNNKIAEAKRGGRGLKNWQWCVVVGAMEEAMKDLEEENKKYRSGELLTPNQVTHFEETTKKYYIHKDKIREKINNIKSTIELTGGRSSGKLVKHYKNFGRIEALEDLLKEE